MPLSNATHRQPNSFLTYHRVVMEFPKSQTHVDANRHLTCKHCVVWVACLFCATVNLVPCASTKTALLEFLWTIAMGHIKFCSKVLPPYAEDRNLVNIAKATPSSKNLL